jgi:hypothetical protein
MHEYEIRGFTRKCVVTGDVIAPGAVFYTVVKPGMPEYTREDYSASAWEGPPIDAIAWWKSIATESGNRKQRVPSEIILEYFEQLEADAERDEERFVLALLMIRRRILRLEESARDERGRELMDLFCHRNEKTYKVRVAIPKTKAKEKEIESRLSRLLDAAQIPDAALGAPTIAATPAPPAVMMLLLLLAIAINAGCLPSWLRRPSETPPPVAYQRMPTLQEVVQNTNDHTLRVRQLQAEGATISYKAPPLSLAIPLRCRLSFDLPRRVRMTAGVGLGGDLVDVGSNDEIFWFWTSAADKNSIFYAKHEEYPNSALGRMIPLDPSWIADAVGLVYLDPSSRLDGPFPSNQKGMFDLRTWLDTPAGSLQRVITFDQSYGYVHAQYLYDPYGQLLAQIRGKEHRYDAAANVTLAHDITVSLPQLQATTQLNVRQYVLNSIGYDNGGRLWEPPAVEGAQMVDVAAPGFDPRRYLTPAGLAKHQGTPRLNVPTTGASMGAPVYPVSQRTSPSLQGWQGPRQVYLGSNSNQLR